MTAERAIEILKRVRTVSNFGFTTNEINQVFDMAIIALKRDVPKSPIIWENKYYYSPTPNDDWGYECPCCGNQEIDYPEHHCICGQALNWDNINK